MAETEVYADFAAVRDQRLKVAKLINQQIDVIKELDTSSLAGKWLSLLDTLADRVQSDSFKVLVLGQFNRGKSTFINALLAEKVLPTYATPTTAVINEVKYGKEKYAVLHPRRARGQRGPVQPKRIPISELEKYVVVDLEDENKPNPFERAEVFWPLELCRSGVEMIDSPGLNEDPAREIITLKYLEEADALIFIMDASQALTNNERTYLEDYIRPMGHEDAFFIFNKINHVDPDERPQTEAWARKKLEPFVKYDQRIFFIDALTALKARQAGDEQALAESGLPAVERSLEHFLTTQRGRLKVLVPARELQAGIRETRQYIRQQLELLSHTLDQLVEEFQRNAPPLERLDIRIKRIEESLDQQIESMMAKVTAAASAFIDDLADRLPALVSDTEITAKMTINPFRIKSATKELVNEATEKTAGIMQSEFAKWRESTYRSLLTTCSETLERNLENDLRDFAAELDSVRLSLDLSTGADAGGATDVVEGMLHGRVVSGVNVEAGAGQSVLSVVRVALPRAGVLAIGGLMIGLAPVIMIPVGVAVFAGWSGKGLSDQRQKMSEAFQKNVGVQAAAKLRDTSAEYVTLVSNSAREQLDQVKDILIGNLQGKVTSLREQMEAALAQRRIGEEEVEATRDRLTRLESRMEGIDASLDRLIDEILVSTRAGSFTHPPDAED
jgi:GTP-binding protein EngB required for normal cell division/predicted nuclease with TOPRIM domain